MMPLKTHDKKVVIVFASDKSIQKNDRRAIALWSSHDLQTLGHPNATISSPPHTTFSIAHLVL